MGNKTLVVSYGGNCVILLFNKVDFEMPVDHPVHPHGRHEEALLAFYAAHTTGNIVIRASDTDVMVVFLGMLGRHIMNQCKVSYENIIVDCGSGNNRRYIDAASPSLWRVIKGVWLQQCHKNELHARTGCDVTANFYRNLDVV